MLRIGSGFDIHQLKNDLPLYIGGVLIPHSKGSEGHSDGDVLIHSLCDAILGALNLGDLGMHFPSGDPSIKGIASTVILDDIILKMRQQKARIVNLDATVFLQQPKLNAFTEAMKDLLALHCHTDKGNLSIKSKTTDFLGPIGEGNAVAAACSILLEVQE